jgi:hypothetical protein
MEPTFSLMEQELIGECELLARERFQGELEISLESDDAITWDAILIAYPSNRTLLECSGRPLVGALTELRDKLRALPLTKKRTSDRPLN